MRSSLLLAGVLFFSSIGFARPIQPQDDDVLARVSKQTSAREQLKLRQLRMMLNRDAKNLGAAAELGSYYLSLGQRTGKAEYYGMAESAVFAWAKEKDAPADIKLIRSAVHRFEHEFTEGLADLNSFIAADSTRTDVLMSRSILYGVTGQLVESEADCLRISKLNAVDLAKLCEAQLKFFRGQFSAVVASIDKILSDTNGSVSVWAQELRASARLHLGLAADAAAELAPLHAEGILSPSGYATFADALIELRHWQNADDLLRELPESVGSVARRAFVQKQGALLHGTDFSSKMHEMIAAMSDTDRKKHARELSYFYLVVVGDQQSASFFARENFSFQKEPIDARLYVQAASPVERPANIEAIKNMGVDPTYAERPF